MEGEGAAVNTDNTTRDSLEGFELVFPKSLREDPHLYEIRSVRELPFIAASSGYFRLSRQAVSVPRSRELAHRLSSGPEPY